MNRYEIEEVINIRLPKQHTDNLIKIVHRNLFTNSILKYRIAGEQQHIAYSKALTHILIQFIKF